MNAYALFLTLIYNSLAGCLALGIPPEGRWKTAFLVVSMVVANALALFFNKIVPQLPQKGLALPDAKPEKTDVSKS